MKPFLLLQHRYLDEASDNEFEAVLHYGNLSENQVHRIRMEKQSIGNTDLNDFSGIIVGGGPANVSDSESEKKPEQLRFESELTLLYIKIFGVDFPYLGMCYGMGSAARFLGGDVSKDKFNEPVGAVTIHRTPGVKDPVLDQVPDSFLAFAGHKEACQTLPDGAVLLAGSDSCPIQMIRYKKNIYATQFHPELDSEGIILRINAYRNHGYFKPEEADLLIEAAKQTEVIYPQQILRNFIQKHRK